MFPSIVSNYLPSIKYLCEHCVKCGGQVWDGSQLFSIIGQAGEELVVRDGSPLFNITGQDGGELARLGGRFATIQHYGTKGG